MKIKSGFTVRKIANEYMAVPTGKRTREVHGLIALNETGAFLWKQLQQERTLDELVDALLQEFEVEEPHARESAEHFIQRLSEERVLEE